MNKKLGFLINEKMYPYFFWALVFIRGIFNYGLPLMDITEVRYAEIARIMSETGNWVVPHIDYGIPFWAKPPLSTWASALSVYLFGDHAFFVRLPYLLLSICIGLFLGRYNKKKSPYLPGILLLCLPEFYIHAGVVSTDLFLSFSIGLIMLSFWEALQDKSKFWWGYLFFLGIGLGLLAKGPIVILLTLPPIGLWCLFTKNIRKSLITAPWIFGTLLCITLSIPWYYLAEMKSPGFIDYFIIGEHFERYFNSNWQGDKYGFPKQQPWGIVWLFFIAFILPWSVLLVRLLINKRSLIWHDSWALFLVTWMLWPLLFFTSSKSLIHPYVLPSMIPVALFLIHFWENVKSKKTYLGISFGIPLTLLFLFLSGLTKPLYENNTDKYLLEELNPLIPIYSLDQKTYSSQFYTQGRIKVIDKPQLEELIRKKSAFYICITNGKKETLSADLMTSLELLKQQKKSMLYSFGLKNNTFYNKSKEIPKGRDNKESQ